MQRGSSYRVIESIENTDFIYQKAQKNLGISNNGR